MRRLPFIPARNSQHRTAALSLYRALLRSASRIELPQNVLLGTSRNPMARAIKKAFVKNRAYTSYRLVYASMAAGYKFLTLLSKAQTPGSYAYDKLSAHIISRHDLTRPPSKQKQKIQPPVGVFLKKVSEADNTLSYKPTYIPYTFRSHIPSVSATADGQPFLRLKKPQPRNLSRMIGRKGRIFVKRIQNLIHVDEDMGWDAAQEDHWDHLVAKQMALEGVRAKFDVSLPGGKHTKASTESFTWSAQLARLWWEWQVERMWRDWIARGEALNQLVEEQRAQNNEVEGMNSRTSAARKGTQRGVKKASSQNFDAPAPNIDVLDDSHAIMASIPAALRQQNSQAGTSIDPFTESAWNSLVKLRTRQLLNRAGSRISEGKLSRPYA